MDKLFTAELISHLIVFLVNLLLAVSVHEAAHAWMSLKWGDDTAYMLGRVTLNPVSHTDPIGTLLIPIMAFVFSAIGGALGAVPLIGWGKPTPVNPNKWTNYKKGNFWVSIAGVLANLILVIIGIIAAKILMVSGVWTAESRDNPIVIFVTTLMILNLSLAVFNLLPIPPLDGGKILGNFLPDKFQPILDMIEQYGFLLLLLFLYLGVFHVIISPFFKLLEFILFSI